THSILRQIYSGHLKLSDYFQASDELERLGKTVPHIVHSIMDRTDVISTPGVLLPALRYANNYLPPNIGLRLVVKGSPFTRMLVDIGRFTAPRLVQHVHLWTPWKKPAFSSPATPITRLPAIKRLEPFLPC
ncbi:MAG: hypothetical protein K8L99_11525, partial [Anaerolineae bacterium]|nr:hypothetical protein [Anaerolineae bacterium]